MAVVRGLKREARPGYGESKEFVGRRRAEHPSWYQVRQDQLFVAGRGVFAETVGFGKICLCVFVFFLEESNDPYVVFIRDAVRSWKGVEASYIIRRG